MSVCEVVMLLASLVGSRGCPPDDGGLVPSRASWGAHVPATRLRWERDIFTGPRGGHYYIQPSGRKRYVYVRG